MITPEERKGMQTQTFFITVDDNDSEYASTYDLSVKALDKSKLMKLDFNFPISGILEKEEIINYKLYVNSKEEMDIKIDLIHERGTPDLYIKQCENLEKNPNCSFTKEEIAQKFDGQGNKINNDELLWHSREETKNEILFTHKPS